MSYPDGGPGTTGQAPGRNVGLLIGLWEAVLPLGRGKNIFFRRLDAVGGTGGGNDYPEQPGGESSHQFHKRRL